MLLSNKEMSNLENPENKENQVKRRGRPRKYFTEEEKRLAQIRFSTTYYYRHKRGTVTTKYETREQLKEKVKMLEEEKKQLEDEILRLKGYEVYPNAN